ncbi:MAG: hypothetical protein SCALA702_12390 [Melioribacteraceae bacterium]|nr:MAG: hypothetical protein SCALA702_12390 [Melioribacteraceae bacterium]
MIKKLILIWLVFSAFSFAQVETNKISSMAGAFSRMGFGARGMAMGNAMSAVTSGNLSSYYNPALSPFQEGNMFQTAYSFLSHDRSLNFLNFTKKFEFGKKDTKKKRTAVAGLSLGIINAGVSNIDGRDNQGLKTGELSTSENQFFIGVSNRFSEKLSVGISIEFYYFDLYDEVTSTAVGIDVGALYRVNENLNLSFFLGDLNAKYEWDTSPVYGRDGLDTDNAFPTTKKIGAAYTFWEYGLLVAAEWEGSNAGTNYLRFGGEYEIIDKFLLRAGLDRLNLSNSDEPVRPSAGFSYFYNVGSVTLGVDYAFVLEPYSAFDQHIVGVNFNF